MSKTKNIRFFALILLTSVLLVVAANPNIANVKAQETTTVDALSSIGGSTVPAAGAYTNYTIGTDATFTAVPGNGFQFLYWILAASSGACTATTNPLTFNVTSNSCAVQAMFIPTSNTTAAPSGQTGSATVDVLTSVGGGTVPASGSQTYTIGNTVDLTANPGSGFQFLCWIVASASGSNYYTTNPLPYNVTANACAVQAMFIDQQSNVTLPTTSTVSEFSTATVVIITMVLLLSAFGTYSYTRRNKK